jgi:hypothetical protein
MASAKLAADLDPDGRTDPNAGRRTLDPDEARAVSRAGRDLRVARRNARLLRQLGSRDPRRQQRNDTRSRPNATCAPHPAGSRVIGAALENLQGIPRKIQGGLDLSLKSVIRASANNPVDALNAPHSTQLTTNPQSL